MVYDVRSCATGINQGICIKRFISIDDGNGDNLENGEKIFGKFFDGGSVKLWLSRGFVLVMGTLKLLTFLYRGETDLLSVEGFFSVTFNHCWQSSRVGIDMWFLPVCSVHLSSFIQEAVNGCWAESTRTAGAEVKACCIGWLIK